MNTNKRRCKKFLPTSSKAKSRPPTGAPKAAAMPAAAPADTKFRPSSVLRNLEHIFVVFIFNNWMSTTSSRVNCWARALLYRLRGSRVIYRVVPIRFWKRK